LSRRSKSEARRRWTGMMVRRGVGGTRLLCRDEPIGLGERAAFLRSAGYHGGSNRDLRTRRPPEGAKGPSRTRPTVAGGSCHQGCAGVPVPLGSLAGNERTAALRASVRRHRRALHGCLWPYVGWSGFHPAAPCSLLNDCHPRPVNAYRGGSKARIPAGPAHLQAVASTTRYLTGPRGGSLTSLTARERRPGPLPACISHMMDARQSPSTGMANGPESRVC
jgi:hypothetical protein